MCATGRSADTYTMPSQPIKHSFKFHVIIDHGCVRDFHPTPNMKGPDSVPHIDGLTATGEVPSLPLLKQASELKILDSLPLTNAWVADCSRGCHNIQLTSFRTWWPIVFWVFGTVVTNAHFIFQDMPQTAHMAHKEFRLQAS